MSEMVDRVAAALMKRMTAIYFDADWDTQPEEVKEDWRLNARAAIEAMREPTEEMKQIDPAYYGRCPTCGGSEQAWPAMIDAALGKVTYSA